MYAVLQVATGIGRFLAPILLVFGVCLWLFCTCCIPYLLFCNMQYISEGLSHLSTVTTSDSCLTLNYPKTIQSREKLWQRPQSYGRIILQSSGWLASPIYINHPCNAMVEYIETLADYAELQ